MDKRKEVLIEVWGDYALFTRPEFKSERLTYDCITPSAARGIIESIYWHPGMKWVIDRIYICNPIKTISIRRNELKSKINARNVRQCITSGGNAELGVYAAVDRTQRISKILKDVRYVIAAHPEMTGEPMPRLNLEKIYEITTRRLSQGQCYRTPYFGCREFPVRFQSAALMPACPRPLLGDKDLGLMLLDMDYSDRVNIEPVFFRAKLRDGVLDVPNPESKRKVVVLE